ncbi:MAG: S9 family peptidase [Oligoflexales bacterium]|nr:S9 family peptidase [Oligoflexales bacterium]
MRPPKAVKIPEIRQIHGEAVSDDYAWLEDKDDKRVTDYINKENSYTKNFFKKLKQLKLKLYTELKSRVIEDESSVPAPDGDYSYFTAYDPGKELYAHKRIDHSTKLVETILDLNELTTDSSNLDLGFCSWSPDHKWLAFSLDFEGSEQYQLKIKNLATGDIVEESPVVVQGSAAWSADSFGIFYIRPDELMRPFQVWYHRLGQKFEEDQLIYQLEDFKYFMDIEETRSGKFVFINLSSNSTSTVLSLNRYLPLNKPELLLEPYEGQEYFFYHGGNGYYILNNKDAPDFQIHFSLEEEVLDKSRWKIFCRERPGILLEEVACFKDFIAIFCCKESKQYIEIYDLKNGTNHFVELPGEIYELELEENYDFEVRKIRFRYSSIIVPDRIYEYEIDEKRLCLLKEYPPNNNFVSDDYFAKRVFGMSRDLEKIPISIFHKKDLKEAELIKAPVYIMAYGAYGLSFEVDFLPSYLSLLDRGIVLAVAHVRGGSEMGRRWYESGKVFNKKNTFTDFIDAIDALIRSGIGQKGRFFAVGESAGGLLIGACANSNPEYFCGMLADVPFVDCLNTMLDPDLPLTIKEYDEWGDPSEEVYYKLIKSYAPYENIKRQAYPPIYVNAGMNDTRVTYWEPLKWVAKLRDFKADDNPLLLNMRGDEGHFGASGRYAALQDTAQDFAFVLWSFGIN